MSKFYPLSELKREDTNKYYLIGNSYPVNQKNEELQRAWNSLEKMRQVKFTYCKMHNQQLLCCDKSSIDDTKQVVHWQGVNLYSKDIHNKVPIHIGMCTLCGRTWSTFAYKFVNKCQSQEDLEMWPDVAETVNI